MKLLLEREGTMEWEIIGLFNSYDEINQWIEEEYDISYDEWIEETINDDWKDATREDWYNENGLRVREIPENFR